MCDCTRRPRSIAVPIHYCPKIPTPTAVIRDLRDLSSDTDSEIAWREPAVDPLLCELVKLRRRAEYISPIRRVPPEIMAEIFLHLTAIDLILGTWDHGDEELFEMERKHKVEPVPHRTPLIFGEVSRQWSDIAFSTPRLWNCISLKCTNANMETNISLCNTDQVHYRYPFDSTASLLRMLSHEKFSIITRIFCGPSCLTLGVGVC